MPSTSSMMARRIIEFRKERIQTFNTHGTGCTYSAAIATNLAKGTPVPEAVRLAKEYVTGAIRHALSIGAGNGPTDHFFKFRQKPDQPED